MAGKLQLSLMPGAIGQPAAKISTNIKLPSFFNLGGNAPAYARVTLSVNADGKLALDELHIDLPKVKLGLMDVEKLRLDFTRAGGDSVWDGQARACLLAACVDASVTIRNGGFKQASANVTLPGEGLPFQPNVNLTQIGAGVLIDPTTFIGRVRVNAYKLYEINGRVALSFPSKEHPFQLTEAAFPGLTPDDYKHSFEVFTLAAAGDASLRFDPLNLTVPLGKAYFVYSWPGYVHVGGEIRQDFGPVTLTGRTSGEFNLKNGKFEFGQDMEACFLKWACRTATTRLSSRGVGACFSLEAFGGTPFETSVTVGGGVLFSPFKILPSLVGCRWSDRDIRASSTASPPRCRPRRRRSPARSQSRSRRAIRVAPSASTAPRRHRACGSPRPTARCSTAPRRGAGADPRAAGAHLGRAQDHHRRPLRAQARYVQDRPVAWVACDHEGDGVRGPRAGASPRASAAAGRSARSPTTWSAVPTQKVTFVEVAAGGKRPLGTVTGGKGTLTVSPAPGADTRRIEAQFELLGIGAETTTVATFRPPSQRLGRPSRVTVSRRSGTLRVAFKRVAEAERYEIVTTLATGGQRTTSTRRTAVTITRVARDSGGTVTVRAVAPMREGAGRTTRFRATAPPAKTRFGRLP